MIDLKDVEQKWPCKIEVSKKWLVWEFGSAYKRPAADPVAGSIWKYQKCLLFVTDLGEVKSGRNSDISVEMGKINIPQSKCN